MRPNEAPERLRDRQQGWHIRKVGHTFASLSSERWGRSLGLLVVVLTTAIGSAAFATLNDDPGDRAQTIVAAFGVAAALAAAVKEYAGFGKASVEHRAMVARWEELTYQADRLADRLKLGIEDPASADNALAKLEARAVRLEDAPPLLHRRAYEKAERWFATTHQRTYRKV